MTSTYQQKTAVSGKRWWLWIVLLPVAAWLAVFGDKSPADGSAALSLPTRSPASTQVGSKQNATPTRTLPAKSGAPAAPEALERLIPRVQLIAGPIPVTSGLRAKESGPGAMASVVQRDLFSGKSWAPPAPQPTAVVAPARVAPPLPFAFIGKKLEGKGWEVYLSRGEQTFIVREGMTFDANYRVERIAPPSLALTYLPLGQAQTLPIGDTR